MNKLILLSFILFCNYNQLFAQVKLGAYNIDKNAITVSGISSGGSMATQMHIAYSSIFSGVGIVTGPPYYCAAGSVNTATSTCMSSLVSTPSATTIKTKIDSYANVNSIDKLTNLANHKVYIWHGTADSTVTEKVVKVNEDLYKLIAPSATIKSIYTYASAHGFITNNYGSACGTTNSQYYINNCNYNQAYEILKFFYNLNTAEPDKTAAYKETLIEFDQTEFYPAGSSSTIIMDKSGYAYVPAACKNGKLCKLHVALHGCLQQKSKIGNVFADKIGFNQVADANDIIIIYPQATSSVLSNPNGCWDWWGFTNANYANKGGLQMQALKNMIDRLSSGTVVVVDPVPGTGNYTCLGEV